MGSETRCRILADKIKSILARGFTLNEAAVHYIDSTFSNPSSESLQAIIHEDDAGEVGPLYELLFFPDLSVQLELEDLLNGEAYTKGDEETILRMLALQLPETPVHFPDDRGSLYVRIPAWTAARFISRLRMNKQLDGRIVQAIDMYIPDVKRNEIRIKFRNSRFIQAENRILFLCTYFEKLRDTCAECLDLIISLFEESDDDGDIYTALAKKKRTCFQGVIKTLRYEQMLRQQNMETLFSQGIRVACIDKQDAERQMEIIDRISHAVFGKTEYFQKPDEVLETNEYRLEE